MKIAYIIYNDITLLDFIGIYDPISRLQKEWLPTLEWQVLGFTPTVQDNYGLTLIPQMVQADLSVYDMVFIPGGLGSQSLIYNPDFLKWIRTTSSTALKTSVCTGSLIWGAAGFLENKRATTHFKEYETLAKFGCTVMKDRIVDDGDLITAGAVASSLDLGLYLCNKWCGPAAVEQVRVKMDYYPSIFI